MARLSAKDFKKGTRIEITQESNLLSLEKNAQMPAFMMGGMSFPLKKGEVYEVVADMKTSSPVVTTLQQVDDTNTIKELKSGQIFWVFLKEAMKVISFPEVKEADTSITDNELKLTESQEFVLVNKNNPALVYKGLEGITADSKDVIEGELVFNPKSGQRKKLKNLISLYGLLHNMSGSASSESFSHHYPYHSRKNGINEIEYNVRELQEVPYWFDGRHVDDLNNYKSLELRKYNSDTRKITETPIDFNVFEYVVEFIKTMERTSYFGPAVSRVTKEIMLANEVDKYPFILGSKFDYTKYDDIYEIPTEKDIYLDLALKTLKLKKKDVYSHNNNGFMAIAFETQEKMEEFKSVYKHPEKVLKEYRTEDVIYEPRIMENEKLKKIENNSKLKM